MSGITNRKGPNGEQEEEEGDELVVIIRRENQSVNTRENRLVKCLSLSHRYRNSNLAAYLPFVRYKVVISRIDDGGGGTRNHSNEE